MGRSAFGAVLVVAAVVVVVSAATGMLTPRAVLLVAWPVAAIACAVAQIIGRNLRFDVGGVRRSLVLPAMGVSLVAPLTMHALLSPLFGATSHDFLEWTGVSLILTAHVHVQLAVLASRALVRRQTGLPATSTAGLVGWCALASVIPVGAFAYVGDRGLDSPVLMALAGAGVAVQVLVLGPVFIVPMMRLLRAAADMERSAATA
jgi:hypothetical protein